VKRRLQAGQAHRCRLLIDNLEQRCMPQLQERLDCCTYMKNSKEQKYDSLLQLRAAASKKKTTA